MSHLVERLLDVPPLVAYLIIAALVFGEAAIFIGFVLPGETAVLLGGVLASNHKISLTGLIILVVLAAVLGDSVGYEVGKHFGPRVLRTRLLRRHERRLDGARDFLRRRGGWAVFLARSTAFLRAVMPGLAGLSGMPYARFLAFNALGGLVWGVGVCVLGFVAGNSYQKVEKVLGRTSALLLAAVVVVGVVVWHRRRKSREDERGAEPGAEPATEPDTEPATGSAGRGEGGGHERAQ